MTLWIGRIVRSMYPRINPVRLRMPFQVEYLYGAIPNDLTLKPLRHWNALQMFSLPAVQVVDHVAQFLNVRHTDASTRSATVQKLGVTPAAIAGVMRSVLCRLTKL